MHGDGRYGNGFRVASGMEREQAAHPRDGDNRQHA
jgi:hypothetical protein